jgi:FHA domain/Domain of unknown function (DUF1707)
MRRWRIERRWGYSQLTIRDAILLRRRDHGRVPMVPLRNGSGQTRLGPGRESEGVSRGIFPSRATLVARPLGIDAAPANKDGRRQTRVPACPARVAILSGMRNLLRASLRARDADRRAAEAVLREGYVHGQIGAQTFEIRLERVLRAKSLHDVWYALADLIPRSRPLTGPTVRIRWPDRFPREALPPPIRLQAPRAEDDPDTLIIGRSSKCDFVLAHASVSRRHAQLRRGSDGSWVLEDLDSTNGTWVNGKRVNRAEVRPGDVIALGHQHVTFAV